MKILDIIDYYIKNKKIQKQRASICENYRRRNQNYDFTLISQNCIGGVIYNDLGIPFYSPTINLFIEDENFVKLAENPEYYFSIEAQPLMDKFIDPINPSICYPKILIEDIEICCLHYHNCQEAIAAWERRRKRVNLNNMYVLGNSWNLHGNIKLIERLSNVDYPTKIFVLPDEAINDKCIVLQDDFWHLDERGIVRPNITDLIPGDSFKYFEKMFDFVGWLNQS